MLLVPGYRVSYWYKLGSFNKRRLVNNMEMVLNVFGNKTNRNSYTESASVPFLLPKHLESISMSLSCRIIWKCHIYNDSVRIASKFHILKIFTRVAGHLKSAKGFILQGTRYIFNFRVCEHEWYLTRYNVKWWTWLWKELCNSY